MTNTGANERRRRPVSPALFRPHRRSGPTHDQHDRIVRARRAPAEPPLTCAVDFPTRCPSAPAVSGSGAPAPPPASAALHQPLQRLLHRPPSTALAPVSATASRYAGLVGPPSPPAFPAPASLRRQLRRTSCISRPPLPRYRPARRSLFTPPCADDLSLHRSVRRPPCADLPAPISLRRPRCIRP